MQSTGANAAVKEHRAECQYGANVQAICLSLMNTTNAAINKVPMLIEGLTKGEVCPSDGYVAKLQRRASQNLKVFRTELELHLIKHLWNGEHLPFQSA